MVLTGATITERKADIPFIQSLDSRLIMGKVLIKRIHDLVMIVSYISASVSSNKWMMDHDFEHNLDTSQLLWDNDGICSLLTCGSLCNSNQTCRSFFYHPSLKKCLGSQSYKRGLPSGQSVQLGWNYYTKSQQCDGNYIVNNTLGLCFKIHPETKTYQEAMDACEAEDAKLIIIRNEVEFVQVRDALKAAGNLTYSFNGLRKSLSNGTITWKWWNGQTPSYLDWQPGEPNDLYGNENCAIIFSSPGSQYKCGDINCLWRNSFICQKNI